MSWSCVDCLWIIVMFLSAVWTLILTAPIHCRGSTGEQVLYCYISPNLFWWRNKLISALLMVSFQQNYNQNIFYSSAQKECPYWYCQELGNRLDYIKKCLCLCVYTYLSVLYSEPSSSRFVLKFNSSSASRLVWSSNI